jgi:hypothetical protein
MNKSTEKPSENQSNSNNQRIKPDFTKMKLKADN